MLELPPVATSQKLVPDEAFIGRKKMHWTEIEDVAHLLPSKAEMENLYIDLRPYLNYTPYTLTPQTTLSRAYKMFRGLGLRHVMVLDDSTNVIGMITRKELTVHRMEELEHELDQRQVQGEEDGTIALPGGVSLPRRSSYFNDPQYHKSFARKMDGIYEDDQYE